VNDTDDVLLRARDALSGAHMDTPVEAIMARSRTRRHRRLAQLSVAGVAASGALAFGVAAVLGATSPAPARARGTIRTAAFTLARNADGTAALALNQDQVFNPSALQQALAHAGIPALVQTGIFCTSTPPPPSNGVVSVQLPGGRPVAKSTPGHQHPVPPDAVTVINPAAMPAGTELSFTYVKHDRALAEGLIYDSAHTCSSAPPAEPPASGNS
jgi:hypothetical protein